MNKGQLKQFREFVSQMSELLEQLATDPETQHLVTEDMEDNLYTMRYLAEEKEETDEGR